VHAWRLRRQLVDPRGSADAVDVVARLCGVQAQVASAAELAVTLRQAEPGVGQVQRALADGTLVKTWAMRGTLHLLAPAQAACFLSLIGSARVWEKGAWQRAFGATPRQVETLVEVVSQILTDTVLTRDELVRRIVEHRELAGMEDSLRSGWAAVLKPLAWQGALCHGPSQGSRVTFTRPSSALSGWTGIPEPEDAAPVAIAAYLGAYGPSTPEIFDAWLSRNALRKADVRRWFADLGDRLVEVDVGDRSAFLLAEHADDLAGTSETASVRLLGAFDQYVLGPGTKDQHLLAPEHRALVSRAAGWISPIVVVGGRITGVWELIDDTVSVSFLPGAAGVSEQDLGAELAHLRWATGQADLRLRLATV
jgi:hypothetical protein